MAQKHEVVLVVRVGAQPPIMGAVRKNKLHLRDEVELPAVDLN